MCRPRRSVKDSVFPELNSSKYRNNLSSVAQLSLVTGRNLSVFETTLLNSSVSMRGRRVSYEWDSCRQVLDWTRTIYDLSTNRPVETRPLRTRGVEVSLVFEHMHLEDKGVYKGPRRSRVKSGLSEVESLCRELYEDI